MFAWFIGGVFLGSILMSAAWSRSEKKDIRRGFIEHNDEFYRLTKVSLRDLEEGQ